MEAMPADPASSWVFALIEFAKDWQTIIAALIALLAALMTIKKIEAQIDLQRQNSIEEKQRYEESRRAKNWAIRAQMPDALSALCRYSEHCIRNLLGNGGADQPINSPIQAVGVLKSAIEFVDSVSAKKIFELVVHYQILNSRLSDEEERDNEREVNERIYDIATFRALVNRLFDFARNEIAEMPDVELNRENIVSGLHASVGIENYFGNRERFEPVVAMIERRHADE